MRKVNDLSIQSVQLLTLKKCATSTRNCSPMWNGLDFFGCTESITRFNTVCGFNGIRDRNNLNWSSGLDGSNQLNRSHRLSGRSYAVRGAATRAHCPSHVHGSEECHQAATRARAEGWHRSYHAAAAKEGGAHQRRWQTEVRAAAGLGHGSSPAGQPRPTVRELDPSICWGLPVRWGRKGWPRGVVKNPPTVE
jgi:hypothetical protein